MGIHRDGVLSGQILRDPPRGFVLVAVSLALLTLLGATGLAVDIGRMYAARSEGQTFTDIAALRAVLQLNGTTDGIDAAVTAAQQTPKHWNFGTVAFAPGDIDVRFGETRDGPFHDVATARASPLNHWFAEVGVRMPVRMWFLPVLTRASEATVRAAAVAGFEAITGFNDNLMPMAPFTNVDICPACGCAGDSYMLCAGKKYTLRWPSNTNNASLNGADQHEAAKTVCEGDNYAARINFYNDVASEREFIIENDASDIKDIIYSGVGLAPVSIGDQVERTDGGKNSAPNALGARVADDTDEESETYEEYKAAGTGNGRRIINVPVLDKDNYVAGFAAFFLNGTASKYSGTNGNQPVCAEYIGSAVVGNPFNGGSGPGPGGHVFRVRLYR